VPPASCQCRSAAEPHWRDANGTTRDAHRVPRVAACPPVPSRAQIAWPKSREGSRGEQGGVERSRATLVWSFFGERAGLSPRKRAS
jgi:hypothetical protein